MKEKREDDNSRPKSVSENLYAKQFTNPQLHVEQEQRTSRTQPQSRLTKGKELNITAWPAGVETLDMGRVRWILLLCLYFICFVYFRLILVVLYMYYLQVFIRMKQ